MKALTVTWVLFLWNKLGETRKSITEARKRAWKSRKSISISRKSTPEPRKYYVNHS